MNFNKEKALAKWSPILEQMGVKDVEKKDWMAEMAEYQHLKSINENGIAYANQGNVAGMGNVVSAQPFGVPGVTVGTNGIYQGSGDYGQQLLPVSMKIAAQTIGLDLVPVKPTPGPKIDLMYVDFRYDDNPTTSGEEKPQLFKLKLATADQATLKTYLENILSVYGIREQVGGLTNRVWVALTGAGNTAGGTLAAQHTIEPTGSKEGVLEFLGFSRVDLLPMFRAYRQVNTASSSGAGSTGWAFDPTKNTFDWQDAMINVVAAGFKQGVGLATGVGATGALNALDLPLVSAMEDNITGYVNNFTNNNKTPMTRGEDDLSYAGIIAPEVSTKSIAVGTISISTALKRTEVEDIKANTGMDIVEKMKSVLVNELSQFISKEIVNKLFEMGELNRQSAPLLPSGSGATIFDFDVNAYLQNSGLSGETSHAVQRKLITKLVNASNYIATEGRVGPATFVVTNGNLAAALMDIHAYSINPVKAKMNGQGQLFPVGTIGEMTIYVDPYMKYNDNRMLVGRKNAPDQPGIVFIPYLMAQEINIISEATFAPRMLLRSRYAVGELGWYPQKQYLTIYVDDPDQVLV